MWWGWALEAAAVLSIPAHPDGPFWQTGPAEIARRLKAHEAARRDLYAVAADLISMQAEMPNGKRATRADVYPEWFGTGTPAKKDVDGLAAKIAAQAAEKKKRGRPSAPPTRAPERATPAE